MPLTVSAAGRPAAAVAAALLGRPGSLPARAALVAVNLAAITFFLLSYGRHGVGFGPYRIDLDVYRLGGRAWLDGKSLYGRLPPTRKGARLPFTYPPIAAALLSPLAMAPMVLAGVALTLASVAATAVVIWIFLPNVPRASRPLSGPAEPAAPGGAGGRGGSWWLAAWLLPPALLLEPVRNTMAYGQINAVLMALVAVDCVLVPPRWRGALTGLAGAVKLTPAAFVLFFLLRRDHRAVATAAMTFLAVTALGFLLAWHDSARYWAGTVLDVSRIGNIGYAGNQSVLSVIARAGLNPHSPQAIAVWLVVSAAVTVAAWRGMRRALAAGQDGLALVLNAFAALLISPISWSHHWVWCVPALLVLAGLGWREHARLPVTLACAGLLIFASGPQWWFPSGAHQELRWALWQQLVGSAYPLYAGLVLVVCAAGGLSPAGPAGERLREQWPASTIL